MSQSIDDYVGVAIRIVNRWHKPLLARFRQDVLQEVHLLAWEAQSRGCITIKKGEKKKRYGNTRRMGLKSYTRAVNAKMYVFRKNYLRY